MGRTRVQPAPLPRLRDAGRKSLLLGTALASTLLMGGLFAPAPALAQTVTCVGEVGPTINIINDDPIDCDNDLTRNGIGYAIALATNNTGAYIDLNNSGVLTATNPAGDVYGIRTGTIALNSRIDIVNTEVIIVTTDGLEAHGIFAQTNSAGSPIDIENHGDITTTKMGDFGGGYGIRAWTFGAGSNIDIETHGDITVTTEDADLVAVGISAVAANTNITIDIENHGDITVATESAYGDAFGINVVTIYTSSPIFIESGGGIIVTTEGSNAQAYGILARTETDDAGSPIDIVNTSVISASTTGQEGHAYGIHAQTFGGGSHIDIENHGDIAATTEGDYARAFGIRALTYGPGSLLGIENHGGITATTEGDDANATGIDARTDDEGNVIDIVNSGNIATATAGRFAYAFGIHALTDSVRSPIFIENRGGITAATTGYGARAYGIRTRLGYATADNAIFIENHGDITASTADIYTAAYGIFALTAFTPTGSPIAIENHGSITAATAGAYSLASGIETTTFGPDSPTNIVNTGDVRATGISSYAIRTYAMFSDVTIVNRGTAVAYGRDSFGIHSHAVGGTSTIYNSGLITAESFRAIDNDGGSTTIVNYGGGIIRGFVDLTDNPDIFLNQAGGVFETKLTSDFRGGGDLFRNEGGGTVQAATDPSAREFSQFINLERFENSGLISMVDGRVGDTLEISNTVGGEDLRFAASGGSTLAVDAFLGGPGSVADEFLINGTVTGRTALAVNNTNPGPGVNGAVIPVIEVGGNVKSDAFFLAQPIDTGFFNYDLFFRPTGSGVFELRSFPGGGALLLPQLITGAHDIWHQGSSTWFDRTADLRVLLAGGATPIAYNPNGGYAEGTAQSAAMTPAVWARGAGAWLDRDATETVTAFGNTYRFDLGRDLDVLDWQMGLDLGTRDLMSQGDILVFGLLGGFVGASLDYDRIARHFDFSGGQVGGYATYLNGGLFVDTLLNAHLLELETRTLGFANSIDANTLGLRTDAGYRFGSFSGGAFIEPLATIAVLWTDIAGFANGGNRVSFDDEANVRGRLGLRVGTSYPVWGTTTVEPFVIGSLWGNLSGDNQATLTSAGTIFRFEDDLDDVWGEVSAGVNFFNPSAQTAVFAKLDVTFGDDVDGIGGKAGMRVSW